jgi:hypothetical protein
MTSPYVVIAVCEVVCGGSSGCELVFGDGILAVSPMLAGSSMVVVSPLCGLVVVVVVALVAVANSRQVGELPWVLI